MRNSKLKDLRAEWMDSRFFFGKNKIMALAFGKSAELEVSDGAHKLGNALKGQCGLLFTNRPKKEVRDLNILRLNSNKKYIFHANLNVRSCKLKILM